MYTKNLVSLFFIFALFNPCSLLGDEPINWADRLYRNTQERQTYERMRRGYRRKNPDKDPGSYDTAKSRSDEPPDVQFRKALINENIDRLNTSLEGEPKEGEKYTSLDAREKEVKRDRLIESKDAMRPLPTTSLSHDIMYFALGNLRWVSAIFNIARASARESLRRKPSADTRLAKTQQELVREQGVRLLEKDARAISQMFEEQPEITSSCVIKKGVQPLVFDDVLQEKKDLITTDSISFENFNDNALFVQPESVKSAQGLKKTAIISFVDPLPSVSKSIEFHASIKSDAARKIAQLRPEYEAQDAASIKKWRNEDRALGALSAGCVIAEDMHTLLDTGIAWKWKSALALSNMAEYWLHGDRGMQSLPASFEAMGLRFAHYQADLDKLKNDTLFKYHAQNFLTSIIPSIARRLCSLCSYAPIDEHLQNFCGYIIDSAQTLDMVRFAYDLFLPIFLLKYHFDFIMPQWGWYVLNNTIIYVVGKFFRYVSSLAYDGHPHMLVLVDRYAQQVAPSMVLGGVTRELISFTHEAQMSNSREAFRVYHRTVAQIFEDTAFETISNINSWCESVDLSQISDRLASFDFPSLPYLKESYYIYGMAGKRFLFKGEIDYNECVIADQPESLAEVLAIMSKNREEVQREEKWRRVQDEFSRLGKY